MQCLKWKQKLLEKMLEKHLNYNFGGRKPSENNTNIKQTHFVMWFMDMFQDAVLNVVDGVVWSFIGNLLPIKTAKSRECILVKFVISLYDFRLCNIYWLL